MRPRPELELNTRQGQALGRDRLDSWRDFDRLHAWMMAHDSGHPLVIRLAEEGLLLCPRCREAQIREDDADFVCTACGARFATYNRVVDFPGLLIHPAPDVDGVAHAVGLARPVARALDLPDTQDVVVRLSEVLRRAASMSAGHDELDAEMRDIADRFGIDTVPIDNGTAATPHAIDVAVERHYVPARMAPGVRLTCNVRFRNRGVESFSSLTSPPVNVGIRWFDARGLPVVIPERRTRFPVVMAPGRAVTLPVQIDTPTVEGSYTLVVCPVIEGRSWLTASGFATTVAVHRSTDDALPPEDHTDMSSHTYAEYNEAARKMLEQRAASLLARPGRRILEVGGGSAPQVSWFGPHDAVNVDINLPLLEFGSIWYENHAQPEVSESLAFICADATRLPFASDTFDIVAMFATLHHFPQPEVLLRECRRLVKPEGLIAVLSEPIGGTLEASDTLRDLVKGINEQIFTLAEYRAIFAAAGLEPIGDDHVGDSLRAFLRPSPPSGATFAPTPSDPRSLVYPSRLRRLWRGVKRFRAPLG